MFQWLTQKDNNFFLINLQQNIHMTSLACTRTLQYSSSSFPHNESSERESKCLFCKSCKEELDSTTSFNDKHLLKPQRLTAVVLCSTWSNVNIYTSSKTSELRLLKVFYSCVFLQKVLVKLLTKALVAVHDGNSHDLFAHLLNQKSEKKYFPPLFLLSKNGLPLSRVHKSFSLWMNQ